jgi:uncharacterized protein (DUF1697 family)
MTGHPPSALCFGDRALERDEEDSMAHAYAALLRGINVGRARRLAMADLRSVMTGLGYTNVRTLLNSGNVAFDASGTNATEAARCMERALTDGLTVSARVIVLTSEELAAAVDDNPLCAVADNASRQIGRAHV